VSETVPQGFSWSATRHGMFESCPRAYFYHYYLALGRAKDADRVRSFEAKRLRSMTSVPMWVGSCVHDAIEGALKAARAGKPFALDQQSEALLDRMRRDYRESRDDLARRRRDYRNCVRFHEHEYGPVPSPEQWKQAADDAVGMFEAWAKMPYLEELREVTSEQILGIEDLDSWVFHGVPVWVKIDLAFRDGEGRVHIVDWKTGRKLTPDNPLQMTGYAVYAERRWGTKLESLAVREIYLRREEPEKWCQIDARSIEAAQERILESIRGMLGVLDDPAVNVAVEEDFPPAPADGKCRRCFFRAICPEKLILE